MMDDLKLILAEFERLVLLFLLGVEIEDMGAKERRPDKGDRIVVLDVPLAEQIQLFQELGVQAEFGRVGCDQGANDFVIRPHRYGGGPLPRVRPRLRRKWGQIRARLRDSVFFYPSAFPDSRFTSSMTLTVLQSLSQVITSMLNSGSRVISPREGRYCEDGTSITTSGRPQGAPLSRLLRTHALGISIPLT